MFRRKSTLGRAEFQHYWRTVHAPIALQIPGLQRYEQNHVVDQGRTSIDGVCQLHFQDASAMQGVFTPAMRQMLMEDEAKFLEGLRTFVVRQETIVPVTEGAAMKCISLVTRRSGLGAPEFEHAWGGDFAEFVKSLPGLRGYRQNFVADRTVERRPVSYEQLPIDCIDEMWLASKAEIDRVQARASELASVIDTVIVEVHVPDHG